MRSIVLLLALVPLFTGVAAAQSTPAAETPPESCLALFTFPVPAGEHPHDVAPAADGQHIWYTAQRAGALGLLDPVSGEVETIPLGAGSSPHGVIVGPDDAAWVTDTGLNAIVRVDAETREVTSWPLAGENANLNTAAFDGDGVLWFTGQNGIVGRLDPAQTPPGTVLEPVAAPRGRGPYGIIATPAGEVYFASLGGSYLGRVVPARTAASPWRRSTRRRRSRARAASGPTPPATSGRVNGTRARSAATTRRRMNGRSGASPARRRRRTPSTSTSATTSG